MYSTRQGKHVGAPNRGFVSADRTSDSVRDPLKDCPKTFKIALRSPVAGLIICCILGGCSAVSGAVSLPVAPAKSPGLLAQFVDECLLIEPGTGKFPKQFQIGSKDDGEFSLPVSVVVIPIRFRICKYEMHQDLYEAVMQNNPSRWKGPRNSVETVSFSDAQEFCRKLTVALHAEKLIGLNELVRLPTEAEWEYCCRAGTTTAFSFGDVATAVGDRDNQASVLSEYAWHTGNAAGNDPAVGSLKPNPWHLYDMHGYLWEFVSEPYLPTGAAASAEPPAAASTDPTPAASSPLTAAGCIIRGGSWKDLHPLLTSASRRVIGTSSQSDAIGFRCVIADRPKMK